MKHYIDPTIDCVFKAILGSPENSHLLHNFLNTILQPASPIIEVTILNPYNEREFITDKLSIVDIRVVDEANRHYQIEVQLSSPVYLHKRVIYSWSRLYQSQLKKGDNFDILQPLVSIWLLTENVITQSPAFHHHFELYDVANQTLLTDQCSIHLLELKKWRKPSTGTLQSQDYWPYFFKEGKHWKQLPKTLDSPEMHQAMKVLEQFSDKEQDYHLYQAREDYARDQRTREALLETERKLKEKALRQVQEANLTIATEKAKSEEAIAVEKAKSDEAIAVEKAKVEALLKRLKEAGIKP
jgi:predicted transposase/invertase (TIGR01784 family)